MFTKIIEKLTIKSQKNLLIVVITATTGAGNSHANEEQDVASAYSTQSISGQVDASDEYRFQPSSHPAAVPPDEDEMRVTLLGTGSPVPSDTRYGMSTLVQAGGLNLLFDAGRGATVRMTQAGVPLGDIDGIFITHFHSDHLNGLGDLWLTGFIPAFGGREGDLHLYGPIGVKELAEGLRQAHADDINVRVADGELERDTTGLVAHEFPEEGVVFEQDGVAVTMFEVLHDPAGAIDPAMGYRVDYEGRSVLISGDTVPHENVIKYGSGVDLLIHEVAEFEDTTALPQVYAHHTNPRQAGKIFTETAPRMAVYSHIVNGTSSEAPGVSEEELLRRTRVNYDGPLKVGEDLMSFLMNDEEIRIYKP